MPNQTDPSDPTTLRRRAEAAEAVVGELVAALRKRSWLRADAPWECYCIESGQRSHDSYCQQARDALARAAALPAGTADATGGEGEVERLRADRDAAWREVKKLRTTRNGLAAQLVHAGTILKAETFEPIHEAAQRMVAERDRIATTTKAACAVELRRVAASWGETSQAGNAMRALAARWSPPPASGSRANVLDAIHTFQHGADEENDRRDGIEPADDGPPCRGCGGPHPFDTSVPSPIWNRVIRGGGLPDYLCTTCIVAAFVRAGEGFCCTLYGGDFHGVPVEIRVGSLAALAAQVLTDENNNLRATLSAVADRGALTDAEQEVLDGVKRAAPNRPTAPPGCGCKAKVAETAEFWATTFERAERAGDLHMLVMTNDDMQRVAGILRGVAAQLPAPQNGDADAK